MRLNHITLAQAMSVGAHEARFKDVLQAMIDGIRVSARDQIDPTFRVLAVRIESGYMDLIGVLSNHELQGSLGRLVKKLAIVRGGAMPPRVVSSQRRRERRPGWVVDALIQVLGNREEPMRAREIHAAVETTLGEAVAWSSVKGALTSNVSGSSPRFVRVARGRYVLVGR